MNRSSADRLRRLRWLLTILFTTMNAVGLVVFAWLIIDADAERGEERGHAALERTTSTVARLLQYSNDTITTAYIDQDEINDMCPQFTVHTVGTGDTLDYASARECVEVDPAVLSGLAGDAIESGHQQRGYVRGTGGGLVQVLAEPLRDRQNQDIGAVVAVSDAEPELARHNRMMLIVLGSSVLLVAGLGLAGHVISGRAIRPALGALQQQEVLLAETAHDLRTPVAALRALAETALRNPGQRAELLPRTVRLAARMGSIIDGLLVRARLAAGVDRLAVQPVWLDQLVAGVVDDTPTEGANVTLTAAPSKVLVDPTLVQRAIGNLLDNALRYGRQPDQPAIVHITVANGRVTVADHGPGITGEVAEEVFDRFRTSGSTGLGLSIVRWVAQAHGGTLSVYNAEDAGAIFELALPTIG